MGRPPSEVTYEAPQVRLTQEEIAALTTLVQNAALPTREPSYNENTFWSIPINITRCRPVPAPVAVPGPWLDFILVPARPGYPRAVKNFIATGQTQGQVEYRWVRRGGLISADSFALDPTVEYNIDRNAAFPYPAQFRPTVIWARADEQLVLQVRNLAATLQLSFCAVQGWYYPQLDTPDELGALEGITDVLR